MPENLKYKIKDDHEHLDYCDYYHLSTSMSMTFMLP